MPQDRMTAALALVTLPCLADNYAFLLHDPRSGATAVVDVPEAEPVQRALAERGWQLSDILITHHHDDHIAGVDALRAATGARVTGAQADAHRLPRLDRAVTPGDRLAFGPDWAEVIAVPGHTLGHVAYHFAQSGLLFSGDSLMAGGCGRLFEGTPAQMWDSLSRLARLPETTLVCSGHEYTAGNLRFAATIEPDNAALRARIAWVAAERAAGRYTVPSTLAEERATNPFLRAGLASVKAAIGLPEASDTESLAELRARKNRF